MSIEQLDVVDAISLDKQSGCVCLAIFDHLEWLGDESEHMYMFQEKLNKYLAFIESGEINDAYKNAKGKCVVIELIAKYPLSNSASVFFEKAKEIVKGAGFDLTFKLSTR